MNDVGKSKLVNPVALKTLFSTVKDHIRLVVLNACYSKEQAEAIAEAIDYVVGMNTAIGDDAAIAFAASFYRAIGFGRSVKDAFNQGKVGLMLEGIEEESTPELFVRKDLESSSLDLALIDLAGSAPSVLLDRACGYWWGRVTTKGHESALAGIRITKGAGTGTLAVEGRSFGRDGKNIAEWRSLFSEVRRNAHRNCVELNYVYEGERHDRPAMTLLFGKADVVFEAPVDPREALQRGVSTFSSVYKSPRATQHSWGKATQRQQTWERAKDAHEFEGLWAAADEKQRKPIVAKVLDGSRELR